MTSSTIDLLDISRIQVVEITDDTLAVDLSDGRTISALSMVSTPVKWFK